ncbi:MAG: hypothetical protein GX025_06210 [Clostridiales bacterium]|nr:hypothetical protein [Clostridiales bacterium]
MSVIKFNRRSGTLSSETGKRCEYLAQSEIVKGDIVLVENISRFARNTKDIPELCNQL